MIAFTEQEREFLSNEFVALNQNFNLRVQYGPDQIVSILDKFQSSVVSLTEQESRLIQSYMRYRIEGLARLTDIRLQHILMTQNHQGFGAPGNPGPSGSTLPPGPGGNIRENFFNPYTQYNLVRSILSRLVGS